jgi:hypothetical protein
VDQRALHRRHVQKKDPQTRNSRLIRRLVAG